MKRTKPGKAASARTSLDNRTTQLRRPTLGYFAASRVAAVAISPATAVGSDT